MDEYGSTKSWYCVVFKMETGNYCKWVCTRSIYIIIGDDILSTRNDNTTLKYSEHKQIRYIKTRTKILLYRAKEKTQDSNHCRGFVKLKKSNC